MPGEYVVTSAVHRLCIDFTSIPNAGIQSSYPNRIGHLTAGDSECQRWDDNAGLHRFDHKADTYLLRTREVTS